MKAALAIVHAGWLALAPPLVTTSPAPTSTTPPCTNVVDRTATCTSPATVDAAITPDAKPAADKPKRDPKLLASSFGAVGTGLLFAAGALGLTTSLGGAPLHPTSTDVALHNGAQLGTVTLLVASGATFATGIILALFDPSTGELHVPFFPDLGDKP